MSLLDTAREETGKHSSGGCSLGEWLAELGDEQRADATAALLDEGVGNTALGRAIEIHHGQQFGRDTISKHRKRMRGDSGGCKCPVSSN